MRVPSRMLLYRPVKSRLQVVHVNSFSLNGDFFSGRADRQRRTFAKSLASSHSNAASVLFAKRIVAFIGGHITNEAVMEVLILLKVLHARGEDRIQQHATQ